MRIPIWLSLVVALIVVVVIVLIGQMLIAPPRPLITDAAFAPELISPNADGSDDITIFTYGLSRNAHITLTFTAQDGTIYAFRTDEARIPNDYNVAFSGVVAGFTLPGEEFGGQQIIRRLIPDGVYTWELNAEEQSGETDSHSGTLTIQNGDAALPLLTEFSVSPSVFTPNQDGIHDRTAINVFLSKPADLKAYLVGSQGEQFPLSERQEAVRLGEAGRHLFDYDGGVDMNVDPPPDGAYTVIADAQDLVGQEVQRTATITIEQGGKPFAQIVPQVTGATVVFEARQWDEGFYSAADHQGALVTPPDDPALLSMNTITLPIGDMLVFKLTVENYGDVSIRTTGPQPGTVYAWDQRASTLGLPDEPGAWRVGLDCTSAMSDYPWRWALGSADTLDVVHDPENDNVYYYLPAGGRAVVWGAVRMTDADIRSPQDCWAGLIHESVAISDVNNVVGSRSVQLVASTTPSDEP